MTLGNRLRKLREAAGLSQDQIAGIAGVSRNAVSQWESDKTKPATSRLNAIARALKVGIDEIIAPSTQMRKDVIDATLKLFERLEIDEISLDSISEASGIPEEDLEGLFESKAELMLEAFRILEDRKLSEIERAPPTYGTLSTQLKYLLRQLYKHDIEHIRIIKAVQAESWTGTIESERKRLQQALRKHELIVGLFDDAAAQGQIDFGNYRAASNLILAAYDLGLRKAAFEGSDPERIISFIEPQIAIILRGFGFRVVPGLAEDRRNGELK